MANNQPEHPLLELARRQMYLHGYPNHMYQQYRSQFYNAKARGLNFTFTLSEWVRWWKDELAKKGEHKQRGNQLGQYMMCRIGDQGGYEPGNVYCGSHKDNAADRDQTLQAEKMRQWHATHDCHLVGKRGDDHPKSKAVIDHEGKRFGSIALASEAHGITRQAGFYRVSTGKWRHAVE